MCCSAVDDCSEGAGAEVGGEGEETGARSCGDETVFPFKEQCTIVGGQSTLSLVKITKAVHSSISSCIVGSTEYFTNKNFLNSLTINSK